MTTKERHDCAAKVYAFNSWHNYRCKINATVFEDDQWYCGTHAPSKVAARKIKRAAKNQAEYDQRQARRDTYEDAIARLTEATHLRGILDPDDRSVQGYAWMVVAREHYAPYEAKGITISLAMAEYLITLLTNAGDS